MAPWDELSYFRSPVASNVVGPTGGTVSAVDANPSRIAIIFGQGGAAGSGCTVVAKKADGTNVTFRLEGIEPWVVTHKDTPGLPQIQWFTNLAAAQTLSIIEIIMSEYPRGKE